jgi:hypothetical protein
LSETQGVSHAPHISGLLFVARLEYLRRARGADCIARIFEAMPPEARERLRGVEADAWYPFSTLVCFNRAAARVLGGAPDLFEELGAASSLLRHEWLGEHAPLVSVHAFLSRVAEEHRRFADFGRGEYRRSAFTEAELSFFDYPETDESFCGAARGYLRAIVERLTGGPVFVEELRCQCRGDDRCAFTIRWTAREKA